MTSPPLKTISRSYICWLAAAVFFLSVAFFLFFEDLARQGLDLFGTLGKGPLSGITIVLFTGAGALLYLSSLAEAIKKKFNRLNAALDRKSTRLNSSHVSISYAVFCLKKK